MTALSQRHRRQKKIPVEGEERREDVTRGSQHAKENYHLLLLLSQPERGGQQSIKSYLGHNITVAALNLEEGKTRHGADDFHEGGCTE